MSISQEFLDRNEKIQLQLRYKVESRPYNAAGKKDGNFNFIHQQDVADAFEMIRHFGDML